jgi:glutamyl-tRNA reductase
VLGDVHILGQLRRGFRDAIAAGSIGAHLHRLFETALRVGKKVKRETHLVSARNSVGAEAGRRAAARVGPLAGRSCVVIGCGKSGTHAARELAALGATQLCVVNRTLERAERLAREVGARAASLDALPALLAGADVAIVASSAPSPLLRAEPLRAARADRGGAPLVVVDISVPRNVESAVADVAGVELIDLDTLHPAAAAIERSRLEAVPAAEALVEESVSEFVRWLELESARRALRPVRDALAEICRREVTFLAGSSPSAERTAERIVARILAHPMIALRNASERGDSIEQTIGALGLLFERADDLPTDSRDGDATRAQRLEPASLRRCWPAA